MHSLRRRRALRWREGVLGQHMVHFHHPLRRRQRAWLCADGGRGIRRRYMRAFGGAGLRGATGVWPHRTLYYILYTPSEELPCAGLKMIRPVILYTYKYTLYRRVAASAMRALPCALYFTLHTLYLAVED